MDDRHELEKISDAFRELEAAEQDFARAQTRLIEAQQKYNLLSNAWMAKLMRPVDGRTWP